MKEKLERLKIQAVVMFLAQFMLVLILEFVFQSKVAGWMMLVVVINTVFVAYLSFVYDKLTNEKTTYLERILKKEANMAIQYGEVGIVMFDENYRIVWMSDFFDRMGIGHGSDKVSMWIPETSRLIRGEDESVEVVIEPYRLEIRMNDEHNMLLFKNVSERSLAQERYQKERLVLGLIHMDNYSETIQFEDEQKIALINTNIRQRVIDWFTSHGMVVRRMRSERFFVVGSESAYQNVVNDRFSILDEVRKESGNLGVAISLSMGFARGCDDYQELDRRVNELVELAQNRGGDQAAIKNGDENVVFFGGSSEAQEKRSRVRVRVMSQTIRNMISDSSNVIIVGHKEMDFDCMGAAFGMSHIAQGCERPTYVVTINQSMESKLQSCYEAYIDDYAKQHQFVSEEEALELMDDKTLLICVDHHVVSLCNAPSVLAKAKRTMVIDHHRRKTDDNIVASMVYIEPSASSATELVVEFLQYQPTKTKLLESEANLMFAGMLVDTNRFRTRSGSRTFEAAAELRKMGADPMHTDELLKDTYDEFRLRTRLVSSTKTLYDEFIVAPITGADIISRADLSKAAEYLLTIQHVKASFVIGHLDENTVAVSARSNGEVNVQIIMEAMNGGGHLTAAALQRKDTTVQSVDAQLEEVIRYYVEERDLHESNTTK